MKKRDPNQMDLFAMTTPESAPPPSTSTPIPPSVVPSSSREEGQDKGVSSTIPSPLRGEGQGEGVSYETNPSAFPPETDTSFDPSDWETGDADTITSPEPKPEESMADTTPAVEAAATEIDPFESDPFFNPAISTPVPPRANPPLAEERLLEQIVQKQPSVPSSPSPEGTPARTRTYTIESIEALSRELETAINARTLAESELDQARQEAEALRSRCATLEEERNIARRDADKERQLRADAARLRPMATFKPAPQELQARRRDLPEGLLSMRSLVLALSGVVVLCLFAFSLGRRQSAGSVTFMEPDAAPPAIEAQPLVAPQPPPVVREAPPATWPSFESTGYRVTGDNTARRVVFEYGTFTRGTILSDAAQRDLSRIAAAFKADIGSFRIEVEGHTDTTPVRSTHAFADNHELAMARATTAMEFLTGKGGLPKDAVTATAAGDKNPPHPGATPDVQRKNRTVVLNITRK